MEAYPYIRENIGDIRQRIECCAGKSGRKASDITLIAVTKTVDAGRIQAAVDLGVENLGENRVSEYLEKKDEINGKFLWHLIGQLQTNKVKYIIGGISLLQSLDRLSLAQEIQRQCEKKSVSQDVLVEVNIAGEETKAGIAMAEIDAFLEQLKNFPRIKVKGLMTVAPFTQDKAFLRDCFSRLYRAYDRLKGLREDGIEMQYLSMGMSGDFEEAILEGSNMIRIGSAIFGPRSK
jgi:pyridoxal phosphate enzyme (YggS family)